MFAGDFALGSTLDVKFTTRQFSTGAPFTLAGTPSVAAYPDNSTTEITAGITLTVDFDARTGLNNIRVVATSGNGYATGTSYALVITAGTVNAVSVVGEVVGTFTLERSAAFGRLGAPAGASVSADIAGVQSDTNDIQTRLPAALTSGGNIKADALAWAGSATATTDIALKDTLAKTIDITGFNDLSAAQVNAEVVDTLATDTYAEPGQGTPLATTTLSAKIGYLYKYLRNRVTVTATTISVFNDDAITVDQKSTHSDDGVTYDRGEFTTGP